MVQDDWNNLIGRSFCKHWAKGKAHTVKHFMQMGINQRLIYGAIARWETNDIMGGKPGSGRKPFKLTKGKKKQLIVLPSTRLGLARGSWVTSFGCHIHM